MATLNLNQKQVNELGFDNANPSFTTKAEVECTISVGDRKGTYDFNTGKLPRHYVLLTLDGFLFSTDTIQYNGTVYKTFKIEEYEKASLLKEKIESMIEEQSPNSIFNFLEND